MNNTLRSTLTPIASALCICLLLNACGGGSSSPSSSSTPPASASTTPPAAASYSIGGNLSGLTSGTLSLLDNGADTLQLTANGAFTFATPIAFNTPFAVTVGQQPYWQSCAVSDGSGTATANVSNVAVNCSPAQAQVTTFAGSATIGSTNGTGTAASFNSPWGIATDSAGNVYVADSDNGLVREITPAGVVTTLANLGTGLSANALIGIAVDSNGNVYVSQTPNNRISKITPSGTISILAGSATGGATSAGAADGTGTAASFNFPEGVAVDSAGNVYVADSGNNEIRKISPAGVVTTLAGSTTPGSADGTGSAASFKFPTGVAVDANGNVYVVDSGNSSLRMITPAGVVTTPTLATSGSSATSVTPAAVAVDAKGNVFVASGKQVFMRTPTGTFNLLAGSGDAGSADGTGTAATFTSLVGITVDTSGNVYVSDLLAERIRKLVPAN
jgi:sugar lactone lactonase YvrE